MREMGGGFRSGGRLVSLRKKRRIMSTGICKSPDGRYWRELYKVALSGKSKLPERIAEEALDDVMYALHVLEETANWARTVHTSSEKHLNNLRLLVRGWRQQAVEAEVHGGRLARPTFSQLSPEPTTSSYIAAEFGWMPRTLPWRVLTKRPRKTFPLDERNQDRTGLCESR